ncbi:MAG TPA: hypothetical protein VFU62_00820, partial [Hanamia sp.]|nr:hypothetical protein [Hanamia sp.]
VALFYCKNRQEKNQQMFVKSFKCRKSNIYQTFFMQILFFILFREVYIKCTNVYETGRLKCRMGLLIAARGDTTKVFNTIEIIKAMFRDSFYYLRYR